MRILLVHNSFRSFVRMDRDILASEHEVDELDLSSPIRILGLPARLARADLVFIWFAGLHSLLPALLGAVLRKGVVSVVGAYDAANIPEINFGHMGHPWKRYVVRAVCRVSTLLVCNSQYAVDTVWRNVRPRTPIRMIHHGIEFPEPAPGGEREQLALTVGQIRKINLARKGLEVFVRAAPSLPGVRFLMVGEVLDGSARYLRSLAGANVEIRDQVPQPELNSLYGRAAAYVQASIHESFGLTVVEAMGSGCVPVVSRRGALPEVVGAHGLFVDESDAQSVAAGIRAALDVSEEARTAAASYARETFPLSKRRQALLAAVSWAARGAL